MHIKTTKIKEANMDAKTIYRRNIYKEGEYPHNLLAAIKEYTDLELPSELTPDMLDGIQYVLSLLPEKSQEVIYQRYQEKKPRTEIAKQFSVSAKSIKHIEDTALRALQRPQNLNCIKYGLEGYRQILKKRQEALDNTPVTKFSIGRLGLTTLAYNRLIAAGCKLIGDVAALSDAEIMNIRNLGAKSRSEIAAALQDNGVFNTEWDKYC